MPATSWRRSANCGRRDQGVVRAEYLGGSRSHPAHARARAERSRKTHGAGRRGRVGDVQALGRVQGGLRSDSRPATDFSAKDWVVDVEQGCCVACASTPATSRHLPLKLPDQVDGASESWTAARRQRLQHRHLGAGASGARASGAPMPAPPVPAPAPPVPAPSVPAPPAPAPPVPASSARLLQCRAKSGWAEERPKV